MKLPSYISKVHVFQSFRAFLKDFFVRGRIVGTKCAYSQLKLKPMRTRRSHLMTSFMERKCDDERVVIGVRHAAYPDQEAPLAEDEVEKPRLVAALQKTNWVVSGRGALVGHGASDAALADVQVWDTAAEAVVVDACTGRRGRVSRWTKGYASEQQVGQQEQKVVQMMGNDKWADNVWKVNFIFYLMFFSLLGHSWRIFARRVSLGTECASISSKSMPIRKRRPH